MEPTLQELPVSRALQAFFWWVNVMMRYIPESTQIWAVTAAKSTICDMLSEAMVNTAVPLEWKQGLPSQLWPLQHHHQKIRTHGGAVHG